MFSPVIPDPWTPPPPRLIYGGNQRPSLRGQKRSSCQQGDGEHVLCPPLVIRRGVRSVLEGAVVRDRRETGTEGRGSRRVSALSVSRKCPDRVPSHGGCPDCYGSEPSETLRSGGAGPQKERKQGEPPGRISAEGNRNPNEWLNQQRNAFSSHVRPQSRTIRG